MIDIFIWVWLVCFVYLIIGAVVAVWQLVTGLLVYPRIMTKGGLKRALDATPGWKKMTAFIAVVWIVIPLGKLYRVITGAK